MIYANRRLEQQRFFEIQQMKNSLELELNQHIKTANRLFKQSNFDESIQEYTKCLELYEQNRKYNDSIAPDFKIVILSLRGVANSQAMNFAEAQDDLDRSHQLNPYNSLTLSRRARFYFKCKRYSEAIEDIGYALVYEPENVRYRVLVSEISEAADHVADDSEGQRLKRQIADMDRTEPEEESDEEALLQFSHLRKIDRASIRIDKKHNTTLSFREDSVVEYESITPANDDSEICSSEDIESILMRQEEELKALQDEEPTANERLQEMKIPKIVNKNKGKSRRSVLRPSLGCSSNSGQQVSSRSSITALSIKNIDGKMVKYDKEQSKIRFRSMVSSTFNQFSELQKKPEEENRCMNVIKEESAKLSENGKEQLMIAKPAKKQRKSCLRPSVKLRHTSEGRFIGKDSNHQQTNLTSAILKTVRPSFFALKNIDRAFGSKEEIEPENEEVVRRLDELDSSDDENQHNVFSETNQAQILQVLENMNNISGGNGSASGSANGSKKSILKKVSGTQGTNAKYGQANSSHWKNSAKKSVCFKTS